MSIQLLRTNAASDAKQDIDQDTGMNTYKKELRVHRLRMAGISAGIFAVAILCIFAAWTSMKSRTYETYEVVNSFERTDTLTTQYTEFLNYVLKYGKDGISCVDSNNNPIWSQTYNMQDPIIHVCQGSIALAEENGTEAMIFDVSGLQTTIQTRLPIRQIVISSQGVLAVLLEDGDMMRVKLYDKKGEELVNCKFELQDAGYPLQISLSADATKLAVTFLQVQNGVVNTCLAFYNFDSVGENYEDHLVSASIVSGAVMPCVQFVDETHCFAVGTGQLLIYEGKQIPEQVAEIPLEKEAYSVFYSEDKIGLVFEGQEQKYALQVYDLQGKLEFETEFDLEYRTLKFSKENILIYNEFECVMLNNSGNIFFTTAFEESVSNLYTLSGKNRYIVMHASRTDQIRLK